MVFGDGGGGCQRAVVGVSMLKEGGRRKDASGGGALAGEGVEG